jgi:excisionase family DNA binding protein
VLVLDTSMNTTTEPNSPSTTEILTLLQRIAADVASLKRQRQPKKLLSLTQAAKQLGVSRNDTLHDLIASKRIRTVKVKGKVRIPASEIERIQSEGA